MLKYFVLFGTYLSNYYLDPHLTFAACKIYNVTYTTIHKKFVLHRYWLPGLDIYPFWFRKSSLSLVVHFLQGLTLYGLTTKDYPSNGIAFSSNY